MQSLTFITSAIPLRVLLGAAVIAIAAFCIYFPSLNGGFVWDDELLITENSLIKTSDGLYRYWFTAEATDYWPVTNTSFWIEWRLWGMNPTGYHVTNLLLHIVESLLIWSILRKLSIPGAFLAAMIFAVHTVNVESVAWISQRKNLMAMLFFLLSILFYLNMETSSTPLLNRFYRLAAGHWYWLSLAAFILAILSKGSVAILPVLLLVFVWWLRYLAWLKMGLSPLVSKWDLVRTAPFFLVSAVLTGVNLWFQTHGTEMVTRTAGFTERLLGAGAVVCFYLYKAILPIDLAFIYPQWKVQPGNLLWWLPLLTVLFVTAVLWWYRNVWSRPFLFAWGFFCVALVPVLGFTDVGFMKLSLVADHYQHIAIIGAIALASAGFSTWYRRSWQPAHWAANVVLIIVITTLAFISWRQCGFYHDAATLYHYILEKNPSCWMAHNNLGLLQTKTGRFHEATEHLQKALQLKPDYPEAYNNLGKTLLDLGRIEESIEYFRQALRLKPDFPEPHNNLGIVLAQTGRPREAIEHYQQALQLKPDYPDAHCNYGNLLSDMGQLPEAIKHYQEALRLKPDFLEAHNNLGNALFQAGRMKEAIEHFEEVLRSNHDYPETRYNLGNALFQVGRLNEAVENYKQALRLKPDYPEAFNNLGLALIHTGRSEEAIGHFKRALQLRPDYITAYKNLALAYARLRRTSDAVDMAQKALELARSQGNTQQAEKIEDWLKSYKGTGNYSE